MRGTYLFGDERGGIDGERDDPRREFEVLLVQPLVHGVGQYGVGTEVPEEYLHQKRRVTEELRKGNAEPHERPYAGKAHDGDKRTQQHGEHE